VGMPSSRQVRMTRTAISPRFAINTLVSTRRHSVSVILDGRVRSALAAETRFGDIRLLGLTGSTNEVASGLAEAGAPEGLVVVADFQTAGRGRLDRAWEARPGDALLVSVLLRPQGLALQRRSLVASAAALAARRACAAVAGVDAGIKWPNDLLAGGAKLAGILAVAGGGAVVVGMGLNVHGGPPGSAWLDGLAGRRVGRAALLEGWLRELEGLCSDWDAVAAGYRSACITVGRDVAVHLASGPEGTGAVRQGRAESVDDLGRLVVRLADGSVEAFAVGDVVHLR
jgi:BirA family biotin operon repressor/biotin-[acetyl-CoA-carboxylase] ligase